MKHRYCARDRELELECIWNPTSGYHFSPRNWDQTSCCRQFDISTYRWDHFQALYGGDCSIVPVSTSALDRSHDNLKILLSCFACVHNLLRDLLPRI